MIKGMTGFGSAQISSNGTKAIMEVKSLNHRYFDITHYLPTGFGSIENKIKQLVEQRLQRGRITVSIKILEKPQEAIVLNKKAVYKHLKIINEIKNEFKLKNDLTVSELLRLPGVLTTKETVVDPEALWPQIETGLTKALAGLELMRKNEGRSLTKDLSDKLNRMNAQTKIIKARHKSIEHEKKKLLSVEEFKSYQKSIDVNEELSRLSHYVDEIKALLKNGVSAGKKIDFIAQEMIRETNTIGSKLQDKIVSNAVITLKTKIEKIREQAQNIE